MKVTKGPWKSFIEERDHTSGSSFIMTGEENYDINFYGLREADQDFIALMRNILPVMLDEILRLQNVLTINHIDFE